jgi:hypothetical protein
MRRVAKGINGRTWAEWDDLDEIETVLGRPDGDRFFSLVAWRMPEGLDFEGSDPRRIADEYLQCGGKADRLTLELRRSEAGAYHQYCIGRQIVEPAKQLSESIRWGDHETLVYPSEVFDSVSAGLVFREYFRSGNAPADHLMRPITI